MSTDCTDVCEIIIDELRRLGLIVDDDEDHTSMIEQLNKCKLVKQEDDKFLITIDVKQFIQDNFSEKDGYIPTTDNEVEQFKEQLEEDLSDWIKGEFSMFTPEASAAEYERCIKSWKIENQREIK